MEGLLQGIPGVVVYLDDVLIIGRTEEEHLHSLDTVLTRSWFAIETKEVLFHGFQPRT